MADRIFPNLSRATAGTPAATTWPGFPTMAEQAIHGFRAGRADALAAIALRSIMPWNKGTGWAS